MSYHVFPRNVFRPLPILAVFREAVFSNIPREEGFAVVVGAIEGCLIHRYPMVVDERADVGHHYQAVRQRHDVEPETEPVSKRQP